LAFPLAEIRGFVSVGKGLSFEAIDGEQVGEEEKLEDVKRWVADYRQNQESGSSSEPSCQYENYA